ncbi:CLUMA_CG006796, isoform A [Clunio marinus]|uniref:CLUMA_CG006796, isoform A n=1 Tax=Clunio marinus TaxID=568069 RepID=A0A1J1HYZ9_9DIPT|nr:CLUMA_CG006796, isoform A [Clunio marinus]
MLKPQTNELCFFNDETQHRLINFTLFLSYNVELKKKNERHWQFFCLPASSSSSPHSFLSLIECMIKASEWIS